ncbi:MAG: hypothetical protein OEW20_09710 [Nitrospira sp.]|nr:hypothetical protein [Nitrospira sp.]
MVKAAAQRVRCAGHSSDVLNSERGYREWNCGWFRSNKVVVMACLASNGGFSDLQRLRIIDSELQGRMAPSRLLGHFWTQLDADTTHRSKRGEQIT